MELNQREIITRLKQIENEMENRRNEPLARYNTDRVHQKQQEFHKCPKRNRWVFGGNRSGKTECGAVEAVRMALGTHPYRENRNGVFGWVVSVSYDVQRDVAQAKILKYLPKRNILEIVMQSGRRDAPELGIIDRIVVRNVFGTKSVIAFKSCESGREKFQGASLDFVWFDEQPPEDIYDECRMRVFDKRGDIFGTMTPFSGLSWVFYRIYLNESGDSEIWQEHINWDDNPYLSPEEVQAMKSSMSDSDLETRCYGKFYQGTGLVYPEFDERVHVIEPFDVPDDWQVGISIDPGLNNPTSCHFYCEHDGVLYVVGEHYEAGKDVAYHAKMIHALADRLGWRRDRSNRLCAIIDSAANQHTLASSKSVSELFAEHGILVNPNVNKDMFSGISRVKELFGASPPKILIFKNCINLIREIKDYWWGDDDRPVKKNDHALDEMRYMVMSRPEAKCPKRQEETAPIKRDIERLIRRNRYAKFDTA